MTHPFDFWRIFDQKCMFFDQNRGKIMTYPFDFCRIFDQKCMFFDQKSAVFDQKSYTSSLIFPSILVADGAFSAIFTDTGKRSEEVYYKML